MTARSRRLEQQGDQMIKIEDIDALLPQPYRTLDRHLSGPVTRNVLFAPGDYFSRDQVRGVVAQVLADAEAQQATVIAAARSVVCSREQYGWSPEVDAAINAMNSSLPRPEAACAGDPGECAFNGACMYRCGRAGPTGNAATPVPPGWTIKRSGEEILISGPADGPGGRYVREGVGSHESQMLYALAAAMIGAPATDDVAPE